MLSTHLIKIRWNFEQTLENEDCRVQKSKEKCFCIFHSAFCICVLTASIPIAKLASPCLLWIVSKRLAPGLPQSLDSYTTDI